MAKVLVHDQIVNELAFDALFHLSQPDKKDRLTTREFRATKSAKKARHFVSQMSLDEKLILFAKIGISYSLIIHNTDWNLKKFFEKYRELTKGQQLADASNIKLAVVSDRMIANFLSVMANITHSDGYLLNMDFHRVGHYVNTWKEGSHNPDNVAEALDHAKMINKLVLVNNMAMKTIRGTTDIGDLDLNILLYLYDAGNRYVPRNTFDNYFAGAYKKTVITAAVKRLAEKSLIDRDPTVRLPQYQITSFGTTAVMEFHSKNLQSV